MKNKILETTLISMYNYPQMSKEVKTIFSTLDLLKVKYDNITLPTVTASYEVKYNSFVRRTGSKLEDFVIKKLAKEEDIENYISNIVVALKKLNYEERVVFLETYVKENVDDNISTTIGYCRDMIIRIRKSAVIKFLSALGLDEKFLY